MVQVETTQAAPALGELEPEPVQPRRPRRPPPDAPAEAGPLVQVETRPPSSE
jgi:hypothetical protein